MSSRHLMTQKRGAHNKRPPRVFWIALIATVVITIVLGIFIAWLLLTQDLSKAASIIELTASIVAILVGPASLLVTVWKRPEREQAWESMLHPNPQVQPSTTPPEVGPTQASTSHQPIEEQSQMSSRIPTHKRRTSGAPRSTISKSEAKDAKPMVTKKRFDVFLSYSSVDKSWVADLKDALKARGLKVWLDSDEIRPGERFASALEKGLEESKTVVMVVSPEAIASGWVNEEYNRALSLAQSNTEPLRLIPVILRDSKLPGFLASRNWVDFRDASTYDKSLERLIWGITDRETQGGAHEIIFHVNGPLSADSDLYVERKADRDALLYLRRMDYISLIEPRQQGKTSLIYRLMDRLSPQGYTFVIYDLGAEKFHKNSEEEWYTSLGTWLLNRLKFINHDARFALPTNGNSWLAFLENIGSAAMEARQKVVIVLDEIREMPSAYSTSFFTVVRSIYNERPMSPAFENLTFITSGVFNPNELIQDENVSKFNVGHRIPLEDFDLPQVRRLVAHLQLPDGVVDTVKRRVFYWTDGQPYLTQRLCLLLAEGRDQFQSGKAGALIDRLAKQLHNDELYVRRLRSLREKEPELLEYVQKHIRNIPINYDRPKFNYVMDDRHFRLAYVYGVIKADDEGYCRIRNRICEQVLIDMSLHTPH